MTAISMRHARVRLGETDVLPDVSLELDARTVAVIGENGSGKSTFARLVAGLVPATSGDVRVLGLDPVRDADALRRRVAVVFSNPDAQIVMPTVAEDVGFSLRALRPRHGSRRGVRRGLRRHATHGDAADDVRPEAGHAPAAEMMDATAEADHVARALERFGLASLADRPAYELSGGQKQLLALAGAFVRHPDLVVADEPTAYLDARNARRVAEHLLADTGHRLLVVTHDLALARRCDRAMLFADGTVRRMGASDEVVAAYERVLAC